jgi:hypothetical protein
MTYGHTMIAALCLSLGLGLTGCAKPAPAGNTLTELDNELVDSAAGGDPQATRAIEGAKIAERSGQPQAMPIGHDCRSGGRSGDCMAAEAINAPNCGNQFISGLNWATRLPAGIELYPGAKVVGAAGNDEGECHIRIVSYVTDAAPQAVVDWYRAGAGKAGYAPQYQRHGREQIVAGTRLPQGDAFHVTVAADGDAGSTVDLIVNHGS